MRFARCPEPSLPTGSCSPTPTAPTQIISPSAPTNPLRTHRIYKHLASALASARSRSRSRSRFRSFSLSLPLVLVLASARSRSRSRSRSRFLASALASSSVSAFVYQLWQSVCPIPDVSFNNNSMPAGLSAGQMSSACGTLNGYE